MSNKIKEKWEKICNEYVLCFAQKHNFDIEFDITHGNIWVGNNYGGICEICDMFIDMNDIRYDVDNNIPEDKFEKWYWKSLDIYELTGNKWLNYESFCKGTPDYYTDEKIAEIKKAKQKVEECTEELNNLIKNTKSL